MVKTRVLTAVVLLPLLWALVHLAPSWAFALLVAVALLLGMREAFAMARARGGQPLDLFGYLLGLVLAIKMWSPALLPIGSWVPFVIMAIGIPIAAMAFRRGPEAVQSAFTETAMPLLWVALPAVYLIALREIDRLDGRFMLYLLFMCVMFSDTAAFFCGRAWGRRRLAPTLSPKKSWEGAIAGLLASVGAVALVRWLWLPQLQVIDIFGIGLLVGTAGILGDLSESVMKRAAGVKDSSALIPGHGGMLDRIDSLLFAAPTLYYYYVWVVQGNL